MVSKNVKMVKKNKESYPCGYSSKLSRPYPQVTQVNLTGILCMLTDMKSAYAQLHLHTRLYANARMLIAYIYFIIIADNSFAAVIDVVAITNAVSKPLPLLSVGISLLLELQDGTLFSVDLRLLFADSFIPITN